MQRTAHIDGKHKLCPTCGPKLLSSFGKDSNSWDRLKRICKDCRKKSYDEGMLHGNSKQRYHERHLRRKKSGAYKRSKLRAFTLTPELFDALLKEQGGVCKVCKTDRPCSRGDWCVDHDHTCCAGKKSCGKCIRGLLCAHCNLALGAVKDSATILQSLIDYLKEFQSKCQQKK